MPPVQDGAAAANALLKERDFCMTSSFGSWRFGHLHAGIDLSTGGVTGAAVLAIDSCWVWRVSVRNEGYGRALYTRLPDGKIAVYGHLSAFAPEIENSIEIEQDLRGSYEVDMYHEPYALRFRKGDIIGYSGESGWGPPHLHFELRSGMYDHFKINPLPDYIECVDVSPPVIRTVRVVPVGEGSTVNGDFSQAGKAVTEPYDTVYISGDFGLLVSATDYTACGRVTSPVFYEARVGTSVVWRLNLNRFPFSKANFIWSIYDFDEDGTRYVRLFNPHGLDLDGFDISRADTGFGGLPHGLHEIVIKVGDDCGNSVLTRIPFYYGTCPRLEEFTAQRDSLGVRVEVRVWPDSAGLEIWYSYAGSPWMELVPPDAPVGRGSSLITHLPLGPGGIDIRCRVWGDSGFMREGLLRVPDGGAVRAEPRLSLKVNGRAVEVSAYSDVTPSALPVATLFEGPYMARIPLQPLGGGFYGGYYVPGCGGAVQGRVVFEYGGARVTAIAGTPVACLERASSAVLLTDSYRLRVDVPRDMRPGVLLGYSEESPGFYRGFTDSLGSLVFEPAGTFFVEKAKVCLALRDGAMSVKQGVFADRGETASFRARADSSGVVCFETDFLERLVVLEDRELPEINDFRGIGRRDDGKYLFRAVASDSGSGIDSRTVRAFVDGEVAIAGFDPDTGLIECRTTKALPEGEHKFTLEVKDRMGNRTSSEYYISLN